LIRHGETEWNLQGRFQGQMDSPLTRKGRDQAHHIGCRLADLVAKHTSPQMHVSPLGRTRETADILRRFRDYPPLVPDARLQEVTLGSWDGLTHSDIDGGWPGRLDGATQFDWYFRAPDGESYETALARIQAWLEEVEGAVIAVSHGLLGRLIRGAYLALPRHETLCLPVPQDVVWHLCQGDVRVIET
jgi:broad specificity phosphatase PhoE